MKNKECKKEESRTHVSGDAGSLGMDEEVVADVQATAFCPEQYEGVLLRDGRCEPATPPHAFGSALAASFGGRGGGGGGLPVWRQSRFHAPVRHDRDRLVPRRPVYRLLDSRRYAQPRRI